MGNSQNPEMANKYGQIYLNTDSINYFQGEIVKGTIFVNLVHPYPGKTLYLVIEGVEFCQWAKRCKKTHRRAMIQEKRKKRGPKGFRDIYSHKIAVFSFGDLKIPIGQWKFPFCFELDKDMPASFKFHTPKIDSFIMYKMKAIIESGDKKVVKDMEFSQELNIFQIKNENYSNISQNVSLEAKVLWFFSQGNTQMNCFLNKNNFLAGEELILTCEIDNKSCKSEIRWIDLQFKRKLQMKSNKGHEKNRNFILLTRRNELYIPENHQDLVTTEFKFKLQNEKLQKIKNINMIPNTSVGKIVKNCYFLKLKINYGGFFTKKTKKIVMPLMIYEKGYEEKFNPVVVEPPENWNPQIMPIRNFSIIDAVFVQPSEIKNEEVIAGYDYPVFNQEDIISDEKYQMGHNN